MSKSLQAQYHEREIDNLKQQDKDWGKKIKQLAGIEVKNNSILTLANNLTDWDLHQLAEIVNLSFVSVSESFTRLNPRFHDAIVVPDNYIISVQDVAVQLQKTNTRKSIGPGLYTKLAD